MGFEILELLAEFGGLGVFRQSICTAVFRAMGPRRGGQEKTWEAVFGEHLDDCSGISRLVFASSQQ